MYSCWALQERQKYLRGAYAKMGIIRTPLFHFCGVLGENIFPKILLYLKTASKGGFLKNSGVSYNIIDTMGPKVRKKQKKNTELVQKQLIQLHLHQLLLSLSGTIHFL